MTPEEKQQQRDVRDAAICAYYLAGHKLSETSRQFQLGRQLVLRILKQHGAWRPYVKSNRTTQVGVAVSEDTKRALQERAEARGVSMSRLGSEVLDAYVNEKENHDGPTS